MKKRYICIHGHFYQPPRENPWLEKIELQESAYPYHDWNARINAECYEPNSVTRILDPDGRIISIVNNYEKISFNFGPTLLSWLEEHAPHVYLSILEADRISAIRCNGHGNAIAQVYNHMIMPLANRQDRITQVVWGIADFKKRFGRDPEGMWLPETAVDMDTLRILYEHGIKFTILSPRQAHRVRPLSSNQWQEVRGAVDPRMPYLVRLPTGGEMVVFFYDGGISHNIAFGDLLMKGEYLANALLQSSGGMGDSPHLINVATDGETYGHHHRFGEMALAYCINYIESNHLAKITNYGEYLELHPPTHEVQIYEDSSWSCAHGVERWRDNCGCNTGMNHGWTQAWRKPLREAMDWLRDELYGIYDSMASSSFVDPLSARNDYIRVILDRSRENVEKFFSAHAKGELSEEEKVRALKLLEMQRNAMLMFTSCGWFFDEISGVETVQIMQYASRAIQYAQELTGRALESDFLAFLERAPSNRFGNGANVYERFVRPARCDLIRVGAHHCISSVFEEYADQKKINCYTAVNEQYERLDTGKLRLLTGKTTITSDITWDRRTFVFAVLHFGDHNISAGVKDYTGEDEFENMRRDVKAAFDSGDIPGVVRLMDQYFDGSIYSLWHLFKDEQKSVLDQILALTYEGIESAYRQIYENNLTIMNYYHELQHKIPRPFLAAAEYIINIDLKRIFEDENLDKAKLKRLIDEVDRWSVNIDSTTIGFKVSEWINTMMERFAQEPSDTQLCEQLIDVLEIIRPLNLSLNLWKAQNTYFHIYTTSYNTMKGQMEKGDKSSQMWIEVFSRLGEYLQVKV